MRHTQHKHKHKQKHKLVAEWRRRTRTTTSKSATLNHCVAFAFLFQTMQPPLHAAPLFLMLLSTAAVAAPAAAAADAAAPGGSSDAAALLVFKDKADPGHRLTSFNASSTGHCVWPGVACSAARRVVRLVIEDAGLTGFLAGGGLDHLDQLRVLSLKSNSLAGPIPDLSSLRNLKALFLAGNRLGGPFPASLLSLRRLRILDLSDNHLAGPIPPSIASLDRLYALRVDSNRFDGPLPSLNQSTLKILNVSHNNFSGAIPATSALSAFGASAFAANPLLCGEAVGRACAAHFLFFPGAATSPSAAAADARKREAIRIPSSPPRWIHKRAIVVAAFVAGALLVIGVLFVALAMQRRRQRRRMEKKGVAPSGESVVLEGYKREIESGNSELMAAAAVAMSEEKVRKLAKSGCLVFCAGEVQLFTLEQLMKSSAEMLGRGRLGTTYKAVLEGGLIVTVKRLDASRLAAAGKEAFERHMEAVGRLRHPNIVPLRTYFQAKEERLLVYDYQPNGSLHSLIHGSRSTRPRPLHWTSCLKIAEDVAQGLAYIHQASRLVHGNIKASNILLGSEFEACLTDNCLSFLIEPSDNEEDSGHRAPEIRRSNGPLTPRSDIYAFGALLLELLTGKPPLQQPVLATTDLPAWVRSMRDDGADDERLTMIIDIAAACVQPSPDSRPTTWQVLKMIQEVKEADTGDNDSDEASLS